MATRNFYIEANIDGRTTQLVGGPASKEGGFDMTVKMRDKGRRVTALKIRGFADADGVLRLEVFSPEYDVIDHEIVSER